MKIHLFYSSVSQDISEITIRSKHSTVVQKLNHSRSRLFNYSQKSSCRFSTFPASSCIIKPCFELESNFLSTALSPCATSKIRPKNHHPFLKTRYVPNPKNVKANCLWPTLKYSLQKPGFSRNSTMLKKIFHKSL